jgi:hypothetical protein
VNHLPPGTSKWNRIEHKLFAFITMNWRGKPLLSEEAIAAQPPRVNLPYVRALVKYLGQIAVAEADDQVRKIDAMLSSPAR